jgi:cell fate (sporulation/competence/biofilm development) regulator YlbF (YheA/YmcA/DUF963 family)
VTRDPDGQPFEVFLNVGKAGSETFASAEALGRLISLALRLNSPLSRAERIRDIADQLEHIGSTSSGAALPSIPDALAKVLREFIAEEASNEPAQLSVSEPSSHEQLNPAPESVSEKLFQPPSLGSDPPATKPRRNLTVINLSLKGKKRKQPMDTQYSLPDEILTTAEQLAAAILRAGPIAAYQQAKARLDGDTQARELLERFLRTQSDLHVRQSRNAVTQSDVDELRALQRQVQSNRIILDYAETQQAAIAYLPAVNQEISQLLGVDFASFAGPSSC